MESHVRIALIAGDDPLVPRHGGQQEMRHTIEALAPRCSLTVVAFSDRIAQPSLAEMTVRDSTIPVLLIPRKSKLQFIRRPLQPLQLARRTVTRSSLDQVKRHVDTAPDVSAVICDNLSAWHLALAVHKWTSAPLFLREHNVESHYLADLARATGTLRGLPYRIDALRMRYAERRACQKVGEGRTFAISQYDARRLLDLTGVPTRTLPPFLGTRRIEPRRSATGQTVLHAGNLYMPNNVAGLRWLIDQIWPRIVESVPTAELVVAGSRPSRTVTQLVCRSPRTSLVADPADMEDLYRAARCAVNPALYGSGISMKSVDAWRFGVPLVTTPLGARGLPFGSAGCSSDPDRFAAHVSDAIRLPQDELMVDEEAQTPGDCADDQVLATQLLSWIASPPPARA